MRTLKLMALLSLIWVLAACGSLEDAPLETLAPSPCDPLSLVPNESCPWGTKVIDNVSPDVERVSQTELGPDRSVYVLIYSYYSYFVRKYTKYGRVAWTTNIGQGQDLTVDSQGNFYVFRQISGSMYLAKYNSAGNFLWWKEVDQGSSGSYSLALTPQDTPMAGVFKQDSYNLHQYDASGNKVAFYGDWYPINSQYSDVGITDMTIDNNGSIYFLIDRFGKFNCCTYYRTILYVLTSSFTHVGTFDWGDGVGCGLMVDSHYNIYLIGSKDEGRGNYYIDTILKLNSALQTVWEYVAPREDKISLSSFALDSSDKLYVVGHKYDSQGKFDAVIQKWDGATGVPLWSKSWHQTDTETFSSVVTASGYVYVGGYDWSNNTYKGLVVRYDSSGNQR